MAQIKSKYQGKEGVYYIVNKAGAVHDCSREHATWRLTNLGYRLATDAEIEQYKETKMQRFDQPIAEPWSPEPVIEPWTPDEEHKAPDGPKATEAAAKLAKAKGVSLKEVTPSGAEGQVLKADVQAYLDAQGE